MIVLYVFLIIVGVLLCFWAGFLLGHVEGLIVGAILIVLGLFLLLIKTGEIYQVFNTLNDIGIN